MPHPEQSAPGRARERNLHAAAWWSWFNRIAVSLSVRTRIVAIALIPVFGLIANGFTFTAGERDIATASRQAQHADALAQASTEFQRDLVTLRITARDFASEADDGQIATFEETAKHALKQLDAMEISAGVDAWDILQSLRTRLGELQTHFAEVVVEQRRLGFTSNHGLRRALREASIAVEHTINYQLAPGNEAADRRIAIALLEMRRFETDYQLRRMQFVQDQFVEQTKVFQKTLQDSPVGDATKAAIGDDVNAYIDTFLAWSESVEKVRPHFVILDVDSYRMVPMADELIASARRTAAEANRSLHNAQTRTRNFIIAVGLAAVTIGLALSWLIGRSITRPLNGLAAVMKKLAAGDTSARIPATRRRDEVGDMARTVIVFRDTMIERASLAATQDETNRARERRGEVIAERIARFEKSVEQVLMKLRAAAGRMETTSGELDGAADSMAAEARQAEDRVNAASTNVTTAAGSVEELAASIGEISHRVHTSTDVAGRAVAEARRTAATMTDLSVAATRIGEVVSLIQAIAGQTNLLALNATIEAARAGEAGRGFAVVASEVKSLAGQTAKATEEIASQVGAIQSAAADAAQAIDKVNATIEDMSAIAASVAATVEEQNSAVMSIAEGVTSASTEARTGADAMSRVAAATKDARATAADVRSLADALALEAEGLEGEVRRFLIEVRAA
jgi:methyl-accepting chemotaxis protein